jgi:hypothetical protein
MISERGGFFAGSRRIVVLGSWPCDGVPAGIAGLNPVMSPTRQRCHLANALLVNLTIHLLGRYPKFRFVSSGR